MAVKCFVSKVQLDIQNLWSREGLVSASAADQDVVAFFVDRRATCRHITLTENGGGSTNALEPITDVQLSMVWL